MVGQIKEYIYKKLTGFTNVVKAGPEGDLKKTLGHGSTRSNC